MYVQEIATSMKSFNNNLELLNKLLTNIKITDERSFNNIHNIIINADNNIIDLIDYIISFYHML